MENGASGSTAGPLGPPPTWLPPLCQELAGRLRGAAIEGIAAGAGWISLRVGGSFLWATALPWLRAIWLDEHPVPGAWLHALGLYRESPFASHLRGRHVTGAALLGDGQGAPCGLALDLAGEPPLRMAVCLWPRPGAIWLQGPQPQPVARTGALPDGAPQDLAEGAAAGACGTGFQLALHGALARAALQAGLCTSVRRRLRDVLNGALRREQRRLDALQHDALEGERAVHLRAQADLLAAYLHTVGAGQAEVTLQGFDGQPTKIALDPARAPAENLQELYRRAARGERKVEGTRQRLLQAAAARERAADALAELDRRHQLEELLELAVELSVDFAPVRAKEHRSAPLRQAQPRLPYRTFVLASGLEVRVGRSAKDNDALTRRHSAPADLWLHAQGVEGSHVVLRSGGTPVSSRDTEQAAQLAALFSKARTSQTVPVVVTQRKYVRKPRGSKPGLAQVERARTLFVTPRMPEGCSAQGEREG